LHVILSGAKNLALRSFQWRQVRLGEGQIPQVWAATGSCPAQIQTEIPVRFAQGKLTLRSAQNDTASGFARVIELV